MVDYKLISYVILGVGFLLFLILKLKLPAFIALLMSSILVATLAGLTSLETIALVKKGMGDTLGFVAVVVGLGAMFGAILEHSGGAQSITDKLLSLFGHKKADWAMVLAGFIIAIPVFFDVAFIIMCPIIYALQRQTKKSLLRYAIPLLAGLAVTHAFVPPTPGPIAVADILKANLGWVILLGVCVGIPTAVISGPLFGRWISDRIFIEAPLQASSHSKEKKNLPSAQLIFFIIGTPILLIVLQTIMSFQRQDSPAIGTLQNVIDLIGHPFVALIIANLLAWYFLGIKRHFSSKQLLKITTASFGPAGAIILLTGAGGVFKQILITTGAGEMLANYFANQQIGVLVFAYIAAVLVRILQGSATVAMITAAGLTAPLLDAQLSAPSLALIVIAISSGASILSHVNDSGFWLVNRYLNLTEKQTFKSWTLMTTILSILSFSFVLLISLFI